MCWTKRSDPVPTADEEALAGDPSCLRGGEEQNHVGHVVWLPHASKRDVPYDRLFRVRGDPPGLDRPWCHHVDCTSVLTELHGGGPAVGLQRRLAGTVRHLTWKRVSRV